ncbi:hypothetical protein ACFQX6_52170 [Streptosporangium lutulentum]
MKKKGFKYVPHVSRKPEKTDPQRRAAEGDHVAARELRAKYGHQIFASYVYPDDPAAGALVADEDDRYVNLLGRLNDSQLIVYQADLGTCAHEAFKAVLHKEVKSFFDLITQRGTLCGSSGRGGSTGIRVWWSRPSRSATASWRRDTGSPRASRRTWPSADLGRSARN